MQEDTIGTRVDTRPMKDLVDNLVAYLAQKIEGLKLVDKEHGLFTLITNKSKDTIVFPPIFSGKIGENIYRFTKDFEEAIITNQVREADKVKTLRKHLAREAKQKIGDHYQDIKAALATLIKYFGNPN